MAYNVKDVFYLSTSVQIDATTGGGAGQLDLSAYIDPIARGRTKGTGLAVYKAHFAVQQANSDSDPIDDAEAGTFSYGLVAGAGLGDFATGTANMSNTLFDNTNALLIQSGAFYGPASGGAPPSSTRTMWPNTGVMPSIDVPYVIVRDNVGLLYQVDDNMSNVTTLSVRLEVAQITLDQATLNQLLRTQTV